MTTETLDKQVEQRLELMKAHLKQSARSKGNRRLAGDYQLAALGEAIIAARLLAEQTYQKSRNLKEALTKCAELLLDMVDEVEE